MTQQYSRQKVAFVASVYRHLSAFHIPYMDWFQQQGFEVHAYASEDFGKELLEQAGVICHDVPFHRSPFQKTNWKALKQLTDGFQHEQFQVLHVHTPVASVLGRIAAKRSRIPVVIYTAHGFHFFKGAPLVNWLTFYPVERLMAKWTDYLITINEEDFKRALAFPVRKEVMFVRGVGVNRTVYKPQSSEDTDQARKRKELGIGANDFVILCVAELIERKNQQQLIKSVASLQQSGPVTCLLVGSGEAEQKLKSMVQSLGLERAVRFLGYRKDVPQLIKIADAVTLLSRQEGLPRALMEGLAAGKPLVATNVRGNRDLVRHGENGFIVELDSIEETVSAFGSLLKDRQLAEQMGEKSLALAHLYDLATISEEMGMIYRKAVDIPHTYSKQEVIG